MKPIEREVIVKIIKLRKLGWSLKEIRKVTGVGAGTAIKYTSEIKILPKYQERLKEKRKSSVRRKKMEEEKAKKEAGKIIKNLSLKEKIILVSALYWAEGNKKDLNLINSDPELIRIFIKALREIFKVPQEDLKLSIRIYEDLNRENCLDYWGEVTGVPVEKFINVDVLKGKKSGKLPFGMCRVRIKKGGNLLKYMVAVRNKAIECFSPHSLTDKAAAS